MKKVLIISNLFHSSPRIPGLARYMHHFDWKPTILTVPIDEAAPSFGAPPGDIKTRVRIVETLHYVRRVNAAQSLAKASTKGIKKVNLLVFLAFRKVYSLLNEILYYPDSERRWIPYAVGRARKLLRTEHFDLILTSSSPASCNIIGAALSREFRIPWIADLRDLWTQNHDYSFSPARKLFERQLEQRTFRAVESFITVSEPLAMKLEKLHRKKAWVIENGFDADDFGAAPPLLNTFAITYAGQIYANKQDPDRFLRSLRDLIDNDEIDDEHLEVRCYGPPSKLLVYLVHKHQLEKVVRQFGIVSLEESHRRQAESQLLLLFNWEDGRQKGIYTQKIFDYLGARRPILATGGHVGDVRQGLLQETGAGYYAMDDEQISGALRQCYQEFKSHGAVAYNGNRARERYSYREEAMRLCRILQNTSESVPEPRRRRQRAEHHGAGG
jgi:hypothetical protein